MVKLYELIQTGNEPSKLISDGTKFVGFVHKGIKYLKNQDYIKSSEVLSAFKLDDLMEDHISMNKVVGRIEKLYVKSISETMSFTPTIDYTLTDYQYKSERYSDAISKKETIQRIDNNKCYPNILKNLPFLPVHDTKFDKIYKYNGVDPIVPHYLYMVKPKKFTHLIPNYQLEAGYVLELATKEGIEFEIKEVMECRIVPNHFTKMVEDLFEIVPDHAKEVICPLFGKLRAEYTSFMSLLLILLW